MMTLDFTKEQSMLMCDNLRSMRINMYPLQIEDDVMIDDRLEEGFIRIYEHFGAFYMPQDLDEEKHQKNVALVAEVQISILEHKKTIWIKGFFAEFGYEKYIHILISQAVLSFAEFYDYSVKILDLRKKVN